MQGTVERGAFHHQVEFSNQSYLAGTPSTQPPTDSTESAISSAFDLPNTWADEHAQLEPPAVDSMTRIRNDMAFASGRTGQESGAESLISGETLVGFEPTTRPEKATAYPPDDLVVMGFVSEIEAGSLFLRWVRWRSSASGA